jgi:hypothetical protein
MTETYNSDLDKENKKTNSNHSSLSITLSPSKSYGKLCLMPGVKQRKIQQWIDCNNNANQEKRYCSHMM